jgi:hypothetical protein
MKYKIQVSYLNNETKEVVNLLLDHEWSDKDVAQSNSNRINSHYKWIAYGNERPTFAMKYAGEKAVRLKDGIYLLTDKNLDKFFECPWINSLYDLEKVTVVRTNDSITTKQ